jgi:hypothetical protein
MNYNTSRLSDNVNNNINRRRRAIGKGSRETLYRNLCKTHGEAINVALRDIARHRVGNTYGEVWNLNTGKTALKKNRLPLLALAHIFANKVGGAPAISVVADFITFVIMHHNLPVEDVVSVVVPPTPTPTLAPPPPPSVAPVVPTPLAANDGDDDWESFADSF